MQNLETLDKKIQSAGLTKRQFAVRLGLTYAGYQARIRRGSEFKASEIYAIRDILGLSAEEVTLIFFGEEAERETGKTDSSLRSE